MDRPYGDHVAVHLLELFLRGLEGIWRRVEFVGLETLIGKLHLKRLVIFLNRP